MPKVKVSREVAEVVEQAIKFADKHSFLTGSTRDYHIIDQIMESNLNNEDCVKAILAFIYGYEIEGVNNDETESKQ